MSDAMPNSSGEELPDFDPHSAARGGPAASICLAASGGGHLRQLLDLEPLWGSRNYFFVTEDTALGRSVATKHPTEFLPHFALGQMRLGASFAMLRSALQSCWRSLRIIRRRRPEYVITTGAGSQCFVVLWARLHGATIILIDSFARFSRPSTFARLVGPLAHHRIAQSEQSAAAWPGAEAFDPLREIECLADEGEKEALLFATVGATLPFDRLSQAIVSAKASGAISEKVILQVGQGSGMAEACEGLEIVETLSFDEIKAILTRARIVVCHGGTGSIITALQHGCSTIVMPRKVDLAEHYDNHQSEITTNFVARGLVLTANTEEELHGAISAAREFAPRSVTTDYSDLINRLEELVHSSRL